MIQNLEKFACIALAASTAVLLLTVSAAIFWVVFGWPPMQCP